MKKGLEGYQAHTNQGNGFRVIRIHYTADPEKRTEEWIKAAKKDFFGTDEGWEREYEINFDAKKGKRVFDCFDYQRNVRPTKYKPEWNLVRGWDFGYHSPACIFCQIDRINLRLIILRELQGEDERIWDFRDRVINITNEHYKDCEFEDFCDYHGKDERSSAIKTDIQYLNERGIFPIGIRAAREQRVEIINHLAYRICNDDLPALWVDPSCIKTIDGLQGGLVYKEPKEGEIPKDELDRQSDYIHLNDALAYILSAKIELHPYRPVKDDTVYQPLYPYLEGSGANV